jgi:hypothetical protein
MFSRSTEAVASTHTRGRAPRLGRISALVSAFAIAGLATVTVFSTGERAAGAQVPNGAPDPKKAPKWPKTPTAPAVCPDADGDGHPSQTCGGALNDDCDDNDSNRYPGNPEVCDDTGHDEDCDPCTVRAPNSAVGDADRDRYTSATCSNVSAAAVPGLVCANRTDVEVMKGVVRGRDCVDTNEAIVPGAMMCSPKDGKQIFVCRDGSLDMMSCPSGTTCVEQPNGTGVCLR